MEGKWRSNFITSNLDSRFETEIIKKWKITEKK